MLFGLGAFFFLENCHKKKVLEKTLKRRVEHNNNNRKRTDCEGVR